MDPIAMITGIKTAIDLATSIKNITDDIELKAKTSELYNSIISLQNGIMSMQAENHSLLQENQLLSKKVMGIKTWEKEKSKYFLHEICPHVFVYASKKTDKATEPHHWICAKCYSQGVKSILQLKEATWSGHHYVCHNCNSEICDHSKSQQIQRTINSGISY
jgi:regulator of replication initiation timing